MDITAMRRGGCSLCRTTTTKERDGHLDGGMKRRISYMLGQMSQLLSVKGKPMNLTFLHRCSIIAYYIQHYLLFLLQFSAEEGIVLVMTLIYTP